MSGKVWLSSLAIMTRVSISANSAAAAASAPVITGSLILSSGAVKRHRAGPMSLSLSNDVARIFKAEVVRVADG
jgi:hypothetical protein